MPVPPDVEEVEEEETEDWGPMVRVIEIPVKALMEGDPRYNIVIRPNDLINIPLGNVGEYFVGGNVARPGAYNLTGRRINVKQAIVSAGGFSPLAWPSRAELTRRVSKDQEQTIQIDLDAIFAGKAADFYLRPNDTLNVGSSPAATFLAVLRNAFRVSYGFGFVYDRNFADSDTFAAEGDPRYNIVIRPNDLINIPLGNVGEYFVGGNVARPGAYNLTGRRINVKQAIVSAGGFSPLAWPSRAELTRRVSKDQEQTIQIDLDAIFAGKAADFYLRPNDTLNVGSSPAATFLAVLRNAFRVSYGFGFVYDRNFADSDTFAAREQVKNRRRIEAQARGVPF